MLCGCGAKGKSDDGTDFHTRVFQNPRTKFHIAWIHAHAREAILFCFRTKLLNLLFRCVGFQESVIDHSGQSGIEFEGPNADARGDAVSAAADDIPDTLLIMHDAEMIGAHAILATGVCVGLVQDFVDELQYECSIH